jgi:hypothetical protein
MSEEERFWTCESSASRLAWYSAGKAAKYGANDAEVHSSSVSFDKAVRAYGYWRSQPWFRLTLKIRTKCLCRSEYDVIC